MKRERIARMTLMENIVKEASESSGINLQSRLHLVAAHNSETIANWLWPLFMPHLSTAWHATIGTQCH